MNNQSIYGNKIGFKKVKVKKGLSSITNVFQKAIAKTEKFMKKLTDEKLKLILLKMNYLNMKLI